ncbi:MAG: hypothetical protein EXS40_00100 [Opitutaceae bacterium]|nr:hypothetical protein [Opitutaceae bacterium]
MQPPRQRRPSREFLCLAREIREHRLRHVLRPERSATALPQPRVIAKPEIPPHKLRNSLLGVCFGIAAEPFGVILSGSTPAVHSK